MRSWDHEIVSTYLRGLAPAPLPAALARPGDVLLRARLLARLSSTRGLPRADRPLWAAGLLGPAAAGLALLALLARSAAGLETARVQLGLAAAAGLPQLIAIAACAGVALAAAIVLPLVLLEE
jgi:hypothetical protein